MLHVISLACFVAIAEAMTTVGAIKKERRTKAAPDTPAKGQHETALGRHPLRGAAQALLSCSRARRLRLAVVWKQELDARASFKLSFGRHAAFCSSDNWSHGGFGALAAVVRPTTYGIGLGHAEQSGGQDFVWAHVGGLAVVSAAQHNWPLLWC